MILQEGEEINWPQRCTSRLLIDLDVLQSHNPCSYPETDLLAGSRKLGFDEAFVFSKSLVVQHKEDKSSGSSFQELKSDKTRESLQKIGPPQKFLNHRGIPNLFFLANSNYIHSPSSCKVVQHKEDKSSGSSFQELKSDKHEISPEDRTSKEGKQLLKEQPQSVLQLLIYHPDMQDSKVEKTVPMLPVCNISNGKYMRTQLPKCCSFILLHHFISSRQVLKNSRLMKIGEFSHIIDTTRWSLIILGEHLRDI
nr:hypothetical protein Iba_chr11bCG13600 [Ipomoea batatas]